METTNAEFAREIFANSLSVAQIATIIEAERLWEYATVQERLFCHRIAKFYGCVSKEGNEENLINFLTTLYHYGIVQGIRAERKKKRGILDE